jgi:hypothetical protein
MSNDEEFYIELNFDSTKEEKFNRNTEKIL